MMLLKAHHNKIFMEFWRSGFADESLKTLKSWCYGSWVDALNFSTGFPVVIKQASSSGGAGVFLANTRREYNRKIKRAGRIVISDSLINLLVGFIKKLAKKIVLYFCP